MKRFSRILGTVLMVVAAASAKLQAQATDSLSRDQRWRQDLAFLARELPAAHANAFARTTRQQFDSAVAALDAAIPAFSDARVMLELTRIVASLHDSHTTLRISARDAPVHVLPIGLSWFDDGMFIMAADAAHASLAGAQLLAINGIAVDEVALRAAAYVAWDNEATLHARVPQFMSIAEVLQAIGVLPNGQAAELKVRRAKGEELVTLEPVLITAPLKLSGPLNAANPPLYQTNPRAAYWFTMLDDRTLYFQYNRCVDDPTHPLSAFLDDVETRLDSTSINRVVVDLRLNGGGNSALLIPFETRMAAWLKNTPGRKLFVLTSGRTFSSAVMNAHELKQLGAVLVGQPTGGRPNHYGEVRTLQLPNSNLVVSYSTRRFTLMRDADPETLMPDILVPLLARDVLAGRDMVIEQLTRTASTAPSQ